MAGNYPDVPAPRMPYDRDGTQMVEVNANGTVNQFSSASLVQANNQSNDYVQVGAYEYLVFIFPQLRNVEGYLIDSLNQNGNQHNVGALETSTNTTTGYDGTWVSHGNFTRRSTSLPASARESIASLSVANIKAIRFRAGNAGGFGFRAVHLYGAIANYTGLDTLRMWHPTLDEPLDDNTSADGAYLDWGDVVRGTSADRTFRIKNNSATLTANSITVSSEVLTNTTPTLESQVTYSDGGAFASSINIGNLSPGAISPVITVRKATDLSATMSIWTLRTVVEAGSWS